MVEPLNLNIFTKQEEIGKSSYGEVYKITENTNGKIFTAKVSLIKLSDDSKTLISDLNREINVISQLNHPSIVKFIGYSLTNFQQEPFPVVISEYVSNSSLYDILKLERESQSPPEWNDTKKLINIYGIASAMSYLHDHEIIHKDLKPTNILEDDYLFPKVADFILSKIQIQSDEKKAPESQGTPKYTSPETLESKDYSKAGDVYSFSIIAYEILSNEEAFKDYSNSTYFSEVVRKGDRPSFKNSIAECYKQLITRCWSQKKEERPTFKEIVSELKGNQKFITNSINKGEFNDYVEYIDNLGSSIDPSKKFQKVTLKSEEEGSLTDFQKLSKFKGFNELPKEVRELFESELNGQPSDKKTIKITADKTKLIYENGLFQSADFINILNFFNAILVDIEHSPTALSEFKGIYKSLTDLKAANLSINIITSHVSTIKEFLQQNGSTFSVTIPPTVKIVSENAFSECCLMKSISIPASITSIKSNAFSECHSLESVNIPSNLTEIGEGAFFQCSSLTVVTIPSKVTAINDFTFQHCLKLAKVTIPSSVTLIGDYSFDKCLVLSEVSIPPSVTRIGDFAFRECAALKRVKFDMHSNLNTIGDFAFRDCKSLTVFEFPPRVNSIGEFAFKGCRALVDISMSYSVIGVGNNAFDGCWSLAQITIPFTAPLIKANSPDEAPVITQIMNPLAPKRKLIGIASDVKINKSTKCTIF